LSPIIDTNNGRYVSTIKSTQTGPAVISGSVDGGPITTGNVTINFTTP
jgi:hypothetical protein